GFFQRDSGVRGGVVYQDVNLPPPRANTLDPAANGGLVEQVHAAEKNFVAQFLRQRLAGRAVRVTKENPRACLMESPRDACADAVGAAGHEHVARLQFGKTRHGLTLPDWQSARKLNPLATSNP